MADEGARPAPVATKSRPRPSATPARRPEPTTRFGRAAATVIERARTADPVSVALIGLPILGFLVMAWRWRWTHDDGFITLRVVDQVFAGHGPVYNPGQRVEVFTSPLHLVLLIVLRGLFGWAVDQAWLGLFLTLGCAIAGLLGAVAGAGRLVRASGAKGRLLPLGILVPVALPPMWEYATSGLETGIAIGWVGISFWLLARVATPGGGPALRRKAAPAPAVASTDEHDGADGDTAAEATRARPVGPRLWPVATFIGLGPLVRPEGAILSIAFVVVLLLSQAVASDTRRRLRLLGAAVALPLAYEIFRMGYYAAVVPNTALAKAAGGSRWAQGWYYFMNFSRPYLLALPLAVFGAWLLFGRPWSILRAFGGLDGRNLAIAMTIGAAVHTLYVVKVGGDYMHARMLLMPAFAFCCPLAVVAQPPAAKAARASFVVLGCVVVLAGWAALVAVDRRAPDPEGFFGGRSIAEQRLFYTHFAGNPHPVTLDEWSRSFSYRTGSQARAAHADDRDVLITAVSFGTVTLKPETQLPPGRGTYLFLDGIGVAGERAGVDVPVIDLHGLADPLASRMPVLEPRGLPGHEKVLPQDWAAAEAGIPASDPAAGRAADALTCGDVAELLRAIDGSITPGRFLRNLVDAPGFTSLVISKDPEQTARACG